MNEEFIAAMKPGASLVNTARGRILRDLDVFYAPLRAGTVSCLGLDVLPTEPPDPESLSKRGRPGSLGLMDAWSSILTHRISRKSPPRRCAAKPPAML